MKKLLSGMLMVAVTGLALFTAERSAKAGEVGEIYSPNWIPGRVCEGSNCARWVDAIAGANPDEGYIWPTAANHAFSTLLTVDCVQWGPNPNYVLESGDASDLPVSTLGCPAGDEVEFMTYWIDPAN